MSSRPSATPSTIARATSSGLVFCKGIEAAISVSTGPGNTECTAMPFAAERAAQRLRERPRGRLRRVVARERRHARERHDRQHIDHRPAAIALDHRRQGARRRSSGRINLTEKLRSIVSSGISSAVPKSSTPAWLMSKLHVGPSCRCRPRAQRVGTSSATATTRAGSRSPLFPAVRLAGRGIHLERRRR